VSFIAENPHLIESKDRDPNRKYSEQYSGCALAASCDFTHSREAGISKDRQPRGLPGIGGEPGGPVNRESVMKYLEIKFS
jgi:hypothetical protein